MSFKRKSEGTHDVLHFLSVCVVVYASCRPESRVVFLRFCHHALMPLAPTMVMPQYWHVLAIPNNATHNAPLAVVGMGNAICANDNI